jgi:hypothetical protein
MSGQAPDFTPTYNAIPNRKVSSTVMGLCGLGIAIGLIATVIGFTGDEVSVHTAQGAFITNFMYFNGIAMGGFIFAAIGMPTYARWQKRFKRISEAFAIFMPVSCLLVFAFFALGGFDAYPWHHEFDSLPPHKHTYFDKGFFWARLIIGMLLMTVPPLIFVKKSLSADLYVASNKMKELGLEVPASWSSGFFRAGEYTSEEEAAEKSQSFMLNFSPILCMTYAVVVSMLSVDISMSLAPHWFTNMFPAWYFMSAGWSGLVWTTLFAILAGKWLGIQHLIRPSDTHDIGKLTFAFCMFWGYTTFAQYLPIWYGNMTEEIGYILIRTHSATWSEITRVMMVLCFAAPWTVLLSRGLKKIPYALASVGVLMAVGIWLERYVVNMASIHTYHMHETGLPLGFIEIGMTMGFLGLFVFTILKFLEDKPGAVVADPFMNPDPDHVEVHPSQHSV